MNPNHYEKLTLAIAAVCSVSMVATASFAQETRPSPILVKSSDIPSKIVIEGTLGHPIGTLLTIRGIWSDVNAKDARRFVVDAVNGKELPDKIVLHDGQVVQYHYQHYKGRAGESAEPWTWKFAWTGKTPAPDHKSGDRWEMMGIETARYEDPSPDFWNEIGGQYVQAAYGFQTRFEFIAVKKLDPAAR
jgi:hypothetical protein